MDAQLLTLGYQLGPSKYTPRIGYSWLRAVISGRPTQRFFDVKSLHLPTYDGRYFHQTQISRHELSPKEAFQVCLGRWSLVNYQGEELHGFSFGGGLQTAIVDNDLYCDFTSSAPILILQDGPGSVSGPLIDEVVDLLAEIKPKLAGHDDEFYSRLSKFEPYAVFLSCLFTLKKRFASVPTHLRNEKFRKANTQIEKAIQIVQNTDGWDGRSPTLEELLLQPR